MKKELALPLGFIFQLDLLRSFITGLVGVIYVFTSVRVHEAYNQM
jgi:hypothetical protein